MNHSILVLISVIAAAFCGITTVGTSPDLLAAIREDLRRNNDDYVESTITGQTFTTKPTTNKVITPIGSDQNITIPDNNQPPSPFRRTLGTTPSPDVILPIVTKRKHKTIKVNTPQHIVNMKSSKTPETEVGRQTPQTKTSKMSTVNRKNGIYMAMKRRLKVKLATSTTAEKAKAEKSRKDEELKNIQAFMKELDKKDATEVTEETSPQAKPQALSSPEDSYGMALVNDDHDSPMVMPVENLPPMVMPLRDQSPRTKSTQRELPLVASTKKELARPMPTLRAVQSAEETWGNLKPKATYETKNPARMGRIQDILKKQQSRQDDAKKIEKLKSELLEGLKLTSLPPGHLLDMWPARGPRVHALRLNDRLCQRSVLLPEGPKYNSRGGTYMPRFKPRLLGSQIVIDFHQTKTPRFLLPRCCNCCRKSVLGCE